MRYFPPPSESACAGPPAPRGEQSTIPTGSAYGPPSLYEAGQDSERTQTAVPVLLAHKWAILLSAGAGAVLGLALSWIQTPMYEARASLEIQTLNENFLNTREVDPTSVNYAADSYIQTQIKLLQSRSLIERTTEKMKRTAAPAEAPQVLRDGSAGAADGEADFERALDQAAESVKIRGSGLTRIIEVYCESSSPRVAADFANTLANEFIRHNLEVRSEIWQRTNDWLNQQLQRVRAKLERSEEVMRAKALESGLVFRGEKENLAEDKLKQLQDELLKAQAERVAKQARWEMASSSPAQSLPDVLDDRSLRDHQTRLNEVRREHAALSASLTPAHPKVKRLELEIAELTASIDKEHANILRRIQNEYGESARREKLLQSAYLAQARFIAEQSGKAIQYELAKREVDTNRALYEGMLQRVKEAGIVSGVSATNARIVDLATPPPKPSRPNPLFNGASGLLLGGFLGTVFVFVRARSDRNLSSPGEVAACLQVPELGVVPSTTVDRKVQQHLGLSARATLNLGPAQLPMPEAGRADITHWQRGPSLFLESIHATLASILFSSPNPMDHSVLVVTSAGPGEGKTLVASNLAVACANVRRRVLLLDADMRKPQIHKIFGLPNDYGLSDILLDTGPLDADSLEPLPRPTSIPGLSVLTGGTGGAQIARILFSPRMLELMQWVRSRFDVVFIDTPPMLQIPDARLLGRQSNGVILVVRSGKTSRDRGKAAMRRLVEDGTTVVGAVLNDWKPKRTASGFDYYDDYVRSHRPE